ncbi:MAG: hypothetical protein GY795_08700 [Desulfobacterales bacterium]|nr:hypothetical protein [Desulfobacterales bacterium]
MKKKKKNFFRPDLFALIFGIFLCSSYAFGTIIGDINGSGEIELRDAVEALQICTGVTPLSYIGKESEINGDDRISLEDAVYVMQFVADIRGNTVTGISEWIPFDDADSNEPGAPEVNVLGSDAEEVTIEYSIPGMRASDVAEEGKNYSLLDMSDAGHTVEIGRPKLPVVRHYVAVPSGAQVSKDIIEAPYKDINGYTVYPLQEPLPDTDGASDPPFEMDMELYQTDAYYPSDIVKVEGPIIIRGVSTVILEMYPVQYNPVKNILRVYSDIKVKLSFEGGTRSFSRKRLRSPSFDKVLGRLLLNPQALFSEKQARAAYDNGNSLLIITDNSFVNAANTLKDWKVKKGIYTEVRTTAQAGNTASDIRDYIKDAYDTWNPPPTYVLFIGDAEFIPVHYDTWHPFNGRCSDCQGNIGTDLYYATVDGDDYFPDISLGRLSVDTSAEADKRVNDIINYEKGVVTDDSFYKNAAVCAYFQHSGGGYAERRFAQTSEDLAIFLSDSSYLGKYSVDRIYYAESDVEPRFWSKRWFGGGPAGNAGTPVPSSLEKPDFAWDGDYNNINEAVNNGCFLVTHRDHGAAWGWGDPYYNTGHVQGLENGEKLPVVWSINCQTGWFDNETDDESTKTPADSVYFSEAWERNPQGGAVGVIAATRVSYSGHNDRLVWGWTDAVWPEFMSYNPSANPFDEPVWEMGQVLNYGKYYYATKYGNDIYRKLEFEIFHWYGDPSMQIRTDVPQSLTVSHASELSEGADSVDVTVNQAGAVICISKDGEILGRGFSNGGLTSISLSTPLVQGDTVVIVVTKYNFHTYEATAACVGAKGLIWDEGNWDEENWN